MENSNFTIDTQQSNQYINKIEDSKIVLNQINAGTTAQVDLKIKPVNKEIFDAGLLSAVSKLNLNGKYMDSTQKDITIKASREVKLEYVGDDEIDEYSIVGSKEADPFTNKISNESPIAKAIIGHKVGDIVNVVSPNGEYQVKVVEIF